MLLTQVLKELGMSGAMMKIQDNGYSENGPRLATFRRSDSEEQRLNWSSCEGNTFLQYATWRKDDDGKWRVVKTQSIRKSEIDEFAAVLQKAKELAKEERSRREDEE